MSTTQAVGIDLGTTYSCISYLNEHGEPVTIANEEGEHSTPSVVLFDGPEVVVGTEALRHAIVHPDRVVQHAKRYMGDTGKHWTVDGRNYSPIDISAFVLRKLLKSAQDQIGPIERAVVTVPAQFSDVQRHATILAGHKAGLQQVDIINEPVAAALCHVLGTEGLWFSELAEAQRLMVYDLGGGTFDLSLVKYQKNEVSVEASVGDLQLGGIDWNNQLQEAIAKQFQRDFELNPMETPNGRQMLSLEAEQAKRALSVRPKSSFTVQYGGRQKSYQVEQAQFEKLTKPLVDRTAKIVKKLLKDRKMGWAHVDVVLTTGGASRMPMIRNMLKDLSGRTLNSTLSPDQSISHGATYYAGMMLTNSKFARSILNEEATARLSSVKQRSVNARALGIMIRDVETNKRVPHYLIPENTALPTDQTKHFGTVVPNQRRVKLQVVESGTSPEQPPVVLGECRINDLPADLPSGSQVAVTIRYDESARVHVSAVDVASGKRAAAEIIRQENMVAQIAADHLEEGFSIDLDKELLELHPKAQDRRSRANQEERKSPFTPDPSDDLDSADEPVPLDDDGNPIDPHQLSADYSAARKKKTQNASSRQRVTGKKNAPERGRRKRSASPPPPPSRKQRDPGEDEFWSIPE
ncbi:Hsp70 family protein [Thalassoroseus pseudoceratinae]|uniref:Hsp70 family protein n=1 Tax=Thalassoroseus pseudoceratinae TaxID=2713176 RepID=UPI001420C820|nr:Hsp70 family protein [Thalassoroseus pseudoceratinae]